MAGTELENRYPGARADSPRGIPARGWWQVLRRALRETSADQMPLIAAGVAFYAFLSFVPALVAGMLTYGLVASPATAQQQVASLSDVLPSSARPLVEQQLTSLATTSDSTLGVGVVVAILLALWSASGGTGNLVTAVNIAYDEKDERGFVRRKALALALTAGAIVVFVVMIALVAVFPAVTAALDLPQPLRVAAQAVRWVVVLAVVALGLAVLYRLAPDRDSPRMRWVSLGATAATVVWLVASLGFSLYVSTFASYGKTYGPLAGVVVMLMWLWLSCLAVLLGAEINAESEQQTVRDTTVGPEQPLGRRHAVKADSTPRDEAPAGA